ncbi:MAG: DNA methyltransferase, partial [Betaproteobacteria bacterium]|nr:DNA methyltransferase [Betaproteobacteria bacterium]
GGEINYIFPLYYNGTEMENGARHENIAPQFRKWLDKKYGKKYPPEKILGYIYAKLHSQNYRKQYAEFLRLDFPRVPFPAKNEEFERLAKIGGELIKAHLLQKDGGKTQLRGKSANSTVEKIEYNEKERKLYFNKTGYFSPVSAEVFNFPIGGYLPLDKFLKSRKGRALSREDVAAMEKAAAAIEFTIKKMKEIDGGHG